MLDRFKDLALFVLATVAILGMASTALCEDWDSYSPAQAAGSEDDDWWTAYPDQHENSGSPVEHPAWVLDALKEKPMLILVHSSNCVPCLTQTPRIKAAVAGMGEDLAFYDVLAEGSSYEKAIDILEVYDPEGVEDKYFVPTTIFITLAQGTDGEVDVAWHSEVDVMSKEKIDTYLKDAIYYHRQNIAAWS
jgi:hypothetical protein